LVDTHSHIASCPQTPEEVMEAARAAGLTRILTVGLDEESNREQIALAEKFDEVYVALGRHPNEAGGFGPESAADIESLAGHRRVVAIGETGLDFYRETADPDEQRLAFEAQIGIASSLDLPIVIHMRDPAGSERAVAEAFSMLDRAGQDLEVILHCFSAPGWVERAIERGWYCSFAGNVTYPANQDLRDAAAKVPRELILAETDAPYLTPQSRRRHRNQPAFVVETAELLAELREVTYEDFSQTVTSNAQRVFAW
jgi:TatD DNase family protein